MLSSHSVQSPSPSPGLSFLRGSFSRRCRCGASAPRVLARFVFPLNSLESAFPKNTPLTPVESAVTRKRPGGGGLWLGGSIPRSLECAPIPEDIFPRLRFGCSWRQRYWDHRRSRGGRLFPAPRKGFSSPTTLQHIPEHLHGTPAWPFEAFRAGSG